MALSRNLINTSYQHVLLCLLLTWRCSTGRFPPFPPKAVSKDKVYVHSLITIPHQGALSSPTLSFVTTPPISLAPIPTLHHPDSKLHAHHPGLSLPTCKLLLAHPPSQLTSDSFLGSGWCLELKNLRFLPIHMSLEKLVKILLLLCSVYIQMFQASYITSMNNVRPFSKPSRCQAHRLNLLYLEQNLILLSIKNLIMFQILPDVRN